MEVVRSFRIIREEEEDLGCWNGRGEEGIVKYFLDSNSFEIEKGFRNFWETIFDNVHFCGSWGKVKWALRGKKKLDKLFERAYLVTHQNLTSLWQFPATLNYYYYYWRHCINNNFSILLLFSFISASLTLIPPLEIRGTFSISPIQLNKIFNRAWGIVVLFMFTYISVPSIFTRIDLIRIKWSKLRVVEKYLKIFNASCVGNRGPFYIYPFLRFSLESILWN